MTSGNRNAMPGSSLLQSNLERSSWDGACFGAMVGLGETFFPAFALALGMGETAAGLIASVPVAAGGVMQLVSLRLMHLFKTEQRWVVTCATIQASAFVPLVVAALLGHIPFALLLLIAVCYWTGGLASGPAWNTWMESIVPASVRAIYFARRSRLQQLATLFGLLAGGSMLHVVDPKNGTMYGFAMLFAFAAFFRFASVTFLATIRPDGRWTQVAPRDPSHSKPKRSANSGRRLIIYLVFVQACVHISGPFFAPFMLEQLEVNYLYFVYLLAVGFLSRVVTLSFWSRIAKNFGADTLMWLGAVALVPIASLWIVSANIFWLTGVQALSGIAWAAYELGFFLLFFETLPMHSRTRMLTYYNLANTMAMLGGALLGATLFNALGGEWLAYYTLFAVSSVGRMTALILLWRVELTPVSVHYLAIRILGIRPATATLDVPILSSMDSDEV